VLAASALQQLTPDLTASIAAMGLHVGEFGKPELVEVPAREAERLFHGYPLVTMGGTT
jgi:hypothetical protein